MNLTPQQVKQAETQLAAADGTVTARIPEAYQWLLVPVQKSPQAGSIEWQAIRLTRDTTRWPCARARSSGTTNCWSPASPARGCGWSWTGSPSGAATTSRSSSSPRTSPATSISLGSRIPRCWSAPSATASALLTWEEESFAFADSFDESTGRYRGLRGGQLVALADADSPGLLVKGDVARAQLDADRANVPAGGGPGEHGTGVGGATTPAQGTTQPGPPKPADAPPKRFHGTVTLDAARVGRDASRVAEEVIAHLTGLVGAKVTVTLEIEAEIPSGASDHVVRTVTENSRTLKFTSQGFEKE